MKYSGMAFQLLALLAIAVYLGGLLDDYLGTSKPWMTILILFLVMGGWFTNVYLDLTRKS
jgi:F0F1-type ATP synthase assembly protein I